METGLIIEADEFFGLTLCEYMMKEGIQVDITRPHDLKEEQKALLEERMMWLGRNDLVRVIDLQDSKDTYDLIFIQSEEPHNRQKDIKAEHGMYQILYEKPENESAKQNVPAVILPRMFGPWTLNEDQTKRADSLFVEDVAKELLQWASDTGQRQDMTYELKVESQTDDKQAEDMIAEWKRQNSTFFDKKQE
ncbi:nad binding enzyme [Bacillus safensis]|uniref:nad binding enzyme n=1 Tax=Bacillus safensis TaxID=561879 RepID=UPI00256FA8D5|nr:nad binding enzyme [Bacillus safensis]WJE40271.1 nad binding enzyme [Bacillus safensis]